MKRARVATRRGAELFEPRPIRSERLVFTPIRADDAPAVERVFVADPEVTRFVAWRPVTDPRGFAEREARAWRDGKRCRGWFARHAATGEVVGCVVARREGGSVDLSYVVTREKWDLGYGTEIARTLLERALRDASTREVWAVCDAENIASRRVLENAGMKFDRVLFAHQKHNIADEPRDCLRYSVRAIDEEWNPIPPH
ncbi:MAG: GNAT family N-acetyltransferase [Planctomycetota bacterium]